MKFIHAADIHLDSPLVGLTAYPDAPADAFRMATRSALENLVSEAITEKVDFVIIAGDLYDGNWKDFNTGIFFARQMGRLRAAQIEVFLVLGNHDAESEMTKKLVLPDNVHKFPSNKAETFKIPALRVALHGRSFKEAATEENLASTYPEPIIGWLNIGVLHTALEGNAAHANYSPCSVAELHGKGYQYWALGHVHEYQVWRGQSVIAFPGNLQGRHIREVGPRGALLVSAVDTEIQSVERLHVDVLRWHVLRVDVSTVHTLVDVVRFIGRHLETLVSDSEPDRPLAVRIILTGATHAHGQLFGLESQLRVEVLSQAATLGTDRVWVEKIQLETEPLNSPSQISARSDALADLQSFLLEAESDPLFVQSLQEDFMALAARVPFELISAVPQLEAIRSGQLREIIRATVPSLVAHVAKVD